MRRPIVLALSLLAAAAPAAAAAATAPGSGHAAGGLFGKLVAASPLAKPGVPGDGRLAIENGRGTVVLSAVGGVVATFDSGDLLVDDPVAGDGSGIVITGADFTRRISSTSTLYRGENVHVLVKSDRFRIRIRAVGIYLGAVGHGWVTLDGSGFTDSGRYQLNGGAWQPLPSDSSEKVQLGGATAPATTSTLASK